MKCFTFWENIKTIINSRYRELWIYFTHMSWHGETVGFPVIFSRLRWPIEPKFSQVCYFLYKLWYTICGPLENTVYRKCPMALISTLSLIEDTVPDVQSSKRAQNRCTNYCTVWGIVIVPRLYSKGTASSNWHRGKIFLCLSMKCTKLCLHVPE